MRSHLEKVEDDQRQSASLLEQKPVEEEPEGEKEKREAEDKDWSRAKRGGDLNTFYGKC